ncbi:sulfite exporter TauE/SafE family protein [Companilactobacillus muriivasis]|uniref:sulfite exporter TauE/SafE family protein n=1 Tax=Companilactobacillus muriivasis TaxID=3081444 RepID=UPI0030C733D2
MITGIIYFFTVLCANVIGAISGMGGGVIIKPIMDSLGRSGLLAINFYSSFAVFIMSIVSTYKQYKNGIDIKWGQALRLAIGSMIGGYLGNTILVTLLKVMKSESVVNIIQIVLLIITLIIALIFTKPLHLSFIEKHMNIYLLLSGVFLGTVATLLGIGGGPINVALLVSLFSFAPKISTTYSIITIFFSQSTKLISSINMIPAMHISLTNVIFILFAAILGGYFGAVISNKVSSKLVLRIYKVTILGVLMINVVNMISLFMKI